MPFDPGVTFNPSLLSGGISRGVNSIVEGFQQMQKARDQEAADEAMLKFALDSGQISHEEWAKFHDMSRGKKNEVVADLARRFTMNQQLKAEKLQEKQFGLQEKQFGLAERNAQLQKEQEARMAREQKSIEQAREEAAFLARAKATWDPTKIPPEEIVAQRARGLVQTGVGEFHPLSAKESVAPPQRLVLPNAQGVPEEVPGMGFYNGQVFKIPQKHTGAGPGGLPRVEVHPGTGVIFYEKPDEDAPGGVSWAPVAGQAAMVGHIFGKEGETPGATPTPTPTPAPTPGAAAAGAQPQSTMDRILSAIGGQPATASQREKARAAARAAPAAAPTPAPTPAKAPAKGADVTKQAQAIAILMAQNMPVTDRNIKAVLAKLK